MQMAELEIRDSTIKLFGKTISLPINHDDSAFEFVSSEASLLQHCKKGNDTDETISGISENPLVEREVSSKKASKTEEQSETSMSSDNKTSKKADKIVLHCPRCNSTETKFCYYNNYNVSQPRHFCKSCQRYWTAGGITRNVPVGAGRRKNKTSSSTSSSSSHFCQFIDKNEAFHTFGSQIQITSQQSAEKNVYPISPQLHGLPWPYPSMAPPPFCLPGFPVPPPYWGWPVINPQNSLTSSSVLGKRSRDGKSMTQINCERQPNEAAARSMNGGGVFVSFGEAAKGKEENHSERWSLLQANPAAFSRALKFREIA